MESAPGRRLGAAGRRRRLPGGAGAELGGLAAGDGLLLLRHAGVAGVPVGGRALVLAKRRPESPGPARVRLGPARAGPGRQWAGGAGGPARRPLR